MIKLSFFSNFHMLSGPGLDNLKSKIYITQTIHFYFDFR